MLQALLDTLSAPGLSAAISACVAFLILLSNVIFYIHSHFRTQRAEKIKKTRETIDSLCEYLSDYERYACDIWQHDASDMPCGGKISIAKLQASFLQILQCSNKIIPRSSTGKNIFNTIILEKLTKHELDIEFDEPSRLKNLQHVATIIDAVGRLKMTARDYML